MQTGNVANQIIVTGTIGTTAEAPCSRRPPIRQERNAR
jgi:hypothetical protein